MTWRDELTAQLSDQSCCGYDVTGSLATEPSAYAALALIQAGRLECAERVAQWLASIQQSDGSVGVREAEPEPCWPTGLAVLVWHALMATRRTDDYAESIRRGVAWTLGYRGLAVQSTEQRGHDPSIGAWSWVAETHSWVEPTALFVLALRATGLANHPRTRSALHMLRDRELPHGGWNYGNTFVLGRELRPHLQPTALALVALAERDNRDTLVHRSLNYLQHNLRPDTATVSLSWSLLALAAYDRWPASADGWLENAYQRACQRDTPLWKRALLSLASPREQSLLLTLPRGNS